MTLQSELNYIKAELARDGRSLDFLCEIIDIENAIKRGESNKTINGLINQLKRERNASLKKFSIR